MLWHLAIFALVGLLAGAAARVFYPGRDPGGTLRTLALGAGGGLVGGMISWVYWPDVGAPIHYGNLGLSLLGALVVLTVQARLSYIQSRGLPTDPPPDASANPPSRTSASEPEVK